MNGNCVVEKFGPEVAKIVTDDVRIATLLRRLAKCIRSIIRDNQMQCKKQKKLAQAYTFQLGLSIDDSDNVFYVIHAHQMIVQDIIECLKNSFQIKSVEFADTLTGSLSTCLSSVNRIMILPRKPSAAGRSLARVNSNDYVFWLTEELIKPICRTINQDPAFDSEFGDRILFTIFDSLRETVNRLNSSVDDLYVSRKLYRQVLLCCLTTLEKLPVSVSCGCTLLGIFQVLSQLSSDTSVLCLDDYHEAVDYLIGWILSNGPRVDRKVHHIYRHCLKCVRNLMIQWTLLFKNRTADTIELIDNLVNDLKRVEYSDTPNGDCSGLLVCEAIISLFNVIFQCLIFLPQSVRKLDKRVFVLMSPQKLRSWLTDIQISLSHCFASVHDINDLSEHLIAEICRFCRLKLDSRVMSNTDSETIMFKILPTLSSMISRSSNDESLQDYLEIQTDLFLAMSENLDGKQCAEYLDNVMTKEVVQVLCKNSTSCANSKWMQTILTCLLKSLNNQFNMDLFQSMSSIHCQLQNLIESDLDNDGTSAVTVDALSALASEKWSSLSVWTLRPPLLPTLLNLFAKRKLDTDHKEKTVLAIGTHCRLHGFFMNTSSIFHRLDQPPVSAEYFENVMSFVTDHLHPSVQVSISPKMLIEFLMWSKLIVSNFPQTFDMAESSLRVRLTLTRFVCSIASSVYPRLGDSSYELFANDEVISTYLTVIKSGFSQFFFKLLSDKDRVEFVSELSRSLSFHAVHRSESVRQRVAKFLADNPEFMIEEYHDAPCMAKLGDSKCFHAGEQHVEHILAFLCFGSGVKVPHPMEIDGERPDLAQSTILGDYETSVLHISSDLASLKRQLISCNASSMDTFAARFISHLFVMNKLKSVFGPAQATLLAVESVIKWHVNNAAKNDISYTEHSFVRRQASMLLKLVDAMDQDILTACDKNFVLSVDADVLESISESVSKFFIANQATCVTWLSRIRPSVSRLASTVADSGSTLYHCDRLLSASTASNYLMPWIACIAKNDSGSPFCADSFAALSYWISHDTSLDNENVVSQLLISMSSLCSSHFDVGLSNVTTIKAITEQCDFISFLWQELADLMQRSCPADIYIAKIEAARSKYVDNCSTEKSSYNKSGAVEELSKFEDLTLLSDDTDVQWPHVSKHDKIVSYLAQREYQSAHVLDHGSKSEALYQLCLVDGNFSLARKLCQFVPESHKLKIIHDVCCKNVSLLSSKCPTDSVLPSANLDDEEQLAISIVDWLAGFVDHMQVVSMSSRRQLGAILHMIGGQISDQESQKGRILMKLKPLVNATLQMATVYMRDREDAMKPDCQLSSSAFPVTQCGQFDYMVKNIFESAIRITDSHVEAWKDYATWLWRLAPPRLEELACIVTPTDQETTRITTTAYPSWALATVNTHLTVLATQDSDLFHLSDAVQITSHILHLLDKSVLPKYADVIIKHLDHNICTVGSKKIAKMWMPVLPQMLARLGRRQPEVDGNCTQSLSVQFIHRIIACILNVDSFAFSTICELVSDTNIDESHGTEILTIALKQLDQDDCCVVDVGRSKKFVSEMVRISTLWPENWLLTIRHHSLSIERRLAQFLVSLARIRDDTSKSLTADGKLRLAVNQYRHQFESLISTFSKLMEETFELSDGDRCLSHVEADFCRDFKAHVTKSMNLLKRPLDGKAASSSSLMMDVKYWSNGWNRLIRLQAKVNTFMSDYMRNGNDACKNVVGAQYQSRMSFAVEDISHCLKDLVAEPGRICLPSETGTFNVASIQSDVYVLATKTRPKKLTFISESGSAHSFLLKGGEDLHLDKNVSQLLTMTNSFLANRQINGTLMAADECSGRLTVRTYQVIALGDRCGLIQWMSGCKSLYAVYKRWHSWSQTSVTPIRSDHAKRGIIVMNTQDYDESGSETSRGSNTPDIEDDDRVRMDHHLKLIRDTPPDLVWKEVRLGSVDALELMTRCDEITRSVSVMSIVGYLIGLGDRHLDNLLLDIQASRSSSLAHIDFNVCFDLGQRLRVPETVPFRLTQNLVRLMGFMRSSGIFRMASITTFKTLRKFESDVAFLLSAFTLRPLAEWRCKLKHRNSNTNDRMNVGLQIEVASLLEVVCDISELWSQNHVSVKKALDKIRTLCNKCRRDNGGGSIKRLHLLSLCESIGEVRRNELRPALTEHDAIFSNSFGPLLRKIAVAKLSTADSGPLVRSYIVQYRAFAKLISSFMSSELEADDVVTVFSSCNSCATVDSQAGSDDDEKSDLVFTGSGEERVDESNFGWRLNQLSLILDDVYTGALRLQEALSDLIGHKEASVRSPGVPCKGVTEDDVQVANLAISSVLAKLNLNPDAISMHHKHSELPLPTSVPEVVKVLTDAAMDMKNLAFMYEGWTSWV